MKNKLPRRYFRITLRAILICLTAVCVFLGWYSAAVHKQKKTVELLNQLNAEILYVHDTDVGGTGEPSAPKWMVNLLGIDYFSYPVVLYLSECSNEDLALATNLQHVRKVTLLDKRVDDLRPLKKWKRLRTLVLFNSPVNELGPIAELENLEFLWLASTKIVDLAPLEKLARRQLDKLFLTGEFASEMDSLTKLDGLKELRIFGRNSNFEFRLIGDLTSLETLWVQGIPVNDLDWVAKLVNLKKITIRKTSVGDLSPLVQLRNLERIEIGRGQAGLNAAKVADLQTSMPNCSVSHAW